MIELTDRARTAVTTFLKQTSGRFSGLRISVRDATCSGVTYALALTEQPEADDITVTCGEVEVFIDRRSGPLLSGCRVDFVDDGGGGFEITNPNVRSCGAGCPSAGSCAS